MTEINWADIRKRLADPAGMEVKVRDGRAKQKFAYIDARAVMDRLDDVVGAENWGSTFRGPFEGLAVECTLTIHGIAKTDVGYPNAANDGHGEEALKAAYSDALKRAAVHWGIGRFLYEDVPPAAQQRRASAPPAQPAPQRSAPAPVAPRAPTLRPGFVGGMEFDCAECGEAYTTVKRVKNGETNVYPAAEWLELLKGKGCANELCGECFNKWVKAA